jgi:hypothetical protein
MTIIIMKFILTCAIFTLLNVYGCSFVINPIDSLTSTHRISPWGSFQHSKSRLRIASEDLERKQKQDDDSSLFVMTDDKLDLETSIDYNLNHFPLSNSLESLENDNDIIVDSGEPFLNIRIPLPTRLTSPGVGWRHHHEATLRLVSRNNVNTISDDEEEEADDLPEPVKHHHGGNPVSNFFKQYIMRPHLVSSTQEWKRLQKHAREIKKTHLRDMLKDQERCDAFFVEVDGVYVDYSRQRATFETMDLLMQLAEKQDLKGKIQAMVRGDKINFTEERAVLHTALRSDRNQIGTIFVDGIDVVAEVHDVLDDIKYFTDGVRSGTIRGCTGKRLRNIVSVGIGGSYLGPEFLHESLKTEPEGINAALGYSLRFLSNVDPVDVERTCADLDPEETLIVIVSKTFTTSETMLNARTMRQWLWDFMGNDKEVVRKHVVACASISSIDKVAEFGIDTENYFFRFWDWVGGRYSVCSAAGAVPISLLYGYDLFEKFLQVRIIDAF